MADSGLTEDLSEHEKDKLKKEKDRMTTERVCVTCKYFPRTKMFLPCAPLCVQLVFIMCETKWIFPYAN